jgi:hypothetical protein
VRRFTAVPVRVQPVRERPVEKAWCAARSARSIRRETPSLSLPA